MKKMNRKMYFVLALCVFIVMGLSSCGFKETYSWYDADGTLLYTEEVFSNKSPSYYQLPSDNDKWDYIEWKNGVYYNEKIAYREPKLSYFIGNVFQIVVKNLVEEPISTGSAFVFNKDGWFITNAHVMEDAYYAQAIFNIPNSKTGESFTYLNINSGTYYHLDKDIYIGKIENYSYVSSYYKNIKVDTEFQIGEKTYSVGYPNSSTELKMNEGEVTETWSDLYEKLYSGNQYICSSSFIAPGSSGGILVNDNLEVIGITTLGWTNSKDEFVVGASISAFNFQNVLQNTNSSQLVTLVDRFHSKEKAYIGYFNEAKEYEKNGNAKKYYYDDGTIAYVYEWLDEGVNGNQVAYTSTKMLSVAEDGFMTYTSEYYWSGSGSRREISFYGYYDYEKGFKNFIYEFKYKWDDGDYYTVKCTDINYSSNLELTLNKCKVESSIYYTPSDENITYAKEQFNIIYEWLVEDMARFK